MLPTIDFPTEAQIDYPVVFSAVLVALGKLCLHLIAQCYGFGKVFKVLLKADPTPIEAVPEINSVRFGFHFSMAVLMASPNAS
ncbi:MAG: hypothetical protein HYY23_20500 [Verrucomicrobia bacterium]|nr:hypothetical protein [Verrucomicrobiota bacterium]